jgi:hypothetical protein
VAQHFSEHFAIGINGYWYQQVMDDQGTLPRGFKAENFDASGIGIGPALTYAPGKPGKSVTSVAFPPYGIETDTC